MPAAATGLADLAGLFLRLGLTAFGGPAAHIALIRDEVVRRRGWLDDREFVDLLGASNLIPGPTSTELALHVGHRRAGRLGFGVVALTWVLPAVVMATALAWAYVVFGARPEAAAMLAGVGPVVVVVVGQACVALGRAIVTAWRPAIVATGAVVASLAGVPEPLVLAAGGLVGLASIASGSASHGTPGTLTRAMAGVVFPAGISGAVGIGGLAIVSPSLVAIFLAFAKIGALLFGSGYLLVAFLRSDLVVGAGWITERHLVDAVAVGQLTPGPVSSTATFIGYLLAGLPGALAATLGMFLPGALFVALSIPILDRLGRSPRARAALNGVNAAALGLLIVVTAGLGGAAIVDGVSLAIALAAAAALVLTRLSPALLVVAAAMAGLAAMALGRAS